MPLPIRRTLGYSFAILGVLLGTAAGQLWLTLVSVGFGLGMMYRDFSTGTESVETSEPDKLRPISITPDGCMHYDTVEVLNACLKNRDH